MNRNVFLLLGTLLLVFSTQCNAANVEQLSFDSFSPTEGSCELKQLGFMTNPKARRFPGKIEREKRGFLCTVNVPKETFDRLFQYCALAFVEISNPVDYVCGVTHFDQSVNFSFGYKYGETEAPMCSFVCPRK
jgi:hypothetical protein